MIRIQCSHLNPVVSYANYLICEPHFQFGPRITSDHQWIYIYKGKGVAKIQNRSYEAREGDLFYYGPQIVHFFKADGKEPFELIGVHFLLNHPLDSIPFPNVRQTSEAFIHFEKNEIKIVGESGSEEYTIPEYMDVRSTQIPELLLQTITQCRQRNVMAAAANRGLLLVILSTICEHADSAAGNYPLKFESVRKLKVGLEQHAEDAFSREWISKWSGYHGDYASRLFRQYYGLSPHRYHTLQKIERAKERLEYTCHSITTISEQLSFGSVHYFCKMFKSHTGMSPLQYRHMRQII